MRNVYLSMIRSTNGGWDVMAAALGLSRQGLENRIYERKGQTVSVDLALQMQVVSETTLFSEAVAAAARGVFVSLPDVEDVGNVELLSKFNELYAELGDLSGKFRDYTSDNRLDSVERRTLTGVGQSIHKTVQELLALTFSVFCLPGGSDKDGE